MPALLPALGPWNALDLLLIVWLCIGFPALQLRSSLRKKGPKRSARTRLVTVLAFLGLPLVLLAADWVTAHRSAGALGLAVPVPLSGEVGFIIAIVLLAGFFVSLLWSRRKSKMPSAKDAKMLDDAGMVIHDRWEAALFLVNALLVGCGTEILFRGFLFWAFDPLAGDAVAVIVAALAYGVGHGFRNRRQAVGAIVSAFAFTIAYAATRSLWWLMLFHMGVGLYGGWIGWRARNAARPALAVKGAA